MGEVLRDMDTARETLAGTIRRIPKAHQVRALNDEALRGLYVDEATTPLERSVYERELIRRESDRQWAESVIKGVNDPNEVKIARAFVKGWLHRYIVGEKTAAQAAWEISRVLKLTYKDGEVVVSGGYGFHDAEGVEVSRGMADATCARNLIPPVCAAAWRAVWEGAPETLEALSEQVKAAIALTDPTRPFRAQRKPRTLATVGEAVKEKQKAARVKAPKVKPAPMALSAVPSDEQEALMLAFFGGSR